MMKTIIHLVQLATALTLVNAANPFSFLMNDDPEDCTTLNDPLGCYTIASCDCWMRKAYGPGGIPSSNNRPAPPNPLPAASPDCEKRVRRNFLHMRQEDRRRYIKAVIAVSRDPVWRDEYYRIIKDHRELFCSSIHCPHIFVPWHRWFILQYENLLRKVDNTVTASFWDWSYDAGDPFNIELWDNNDYSFGKNGKPLTNIVDTGPFRDSEWKMVPVEGPWSYLKLRRRFNFTDPHTATAQSLAILLQLTPERVFQFVKLLQHYHDNLHCAFGENGTMCNFVSAFAPEFFLHHVFIDKIWAIWQNKGPQYKFDWMHMAQTVKMEASRPIEGNVDGYLPKDFVDLNNQPGNICVEYEETPDGLKKWEGLTLAEIRAIRGLQIPRLSADAIKLFNRKPADIKLMDDFIASHGVLNPVTKDKLTGESKKRGFIVSDFPQK